MEGNTMPDWEVILWSFIVTPALIGTGLYIWLKKSFDRHRAQSEFSKKAQEAYIHSGPKRDKMITELLKEGADWDHIAFVLNSAGFRLWDGRPFTSETVRSEHAAIFLQKHVD